MTVRVLRRYDLTVDVVRKATAHRLAGDWRAACRAARITLDPSLWMVPGLAVELRYLAPEVLRWHVLTPHFDPVSWAGWELVRHGQRAVVLTTRFLSSGTVRLTLLAMNLSKPRSVFTSSPPHLRQTPRCLWDARHTGELREHLGDTVPWYLDAIARGELVPANLPPLVRTALFPAGPDEPYTPAPGVPVPDRIHVQCTGRHYVGWRDGELRLLSHDPDEVRRERTLHRLGGRAPGGCFRVLAAWERRTGRLPDAMRRVTRHMLLAASHGDLPELTRLLDAGVDPRGVRGVQRQTLLDAADAVQDRATLRRLRDAGL